MSVNVKALWCGAACAIAITVGADTGKATAADVCAACHGANGISVAEHVPNLAGQRAGYLMGQLRALKDGSRKHEVMNPIAAQLSDADISSLAAYFAAQPGANTHAKTPFLANFSNSKMTFPTNYKTAFTRYHAINQPESKSVTIYYANDKALAAAVAGKPLPDGAVIIAENHTAKLDAEAKPLVGKDGFFVAEKLTSYAGMARESKWGDNLPDMLRNGNWNYALFGADRQVRTNGNYAECFACHKAIEKSGFVFTLKEMAASPAHARKS